MGTVDKFLGMFSEPQQIEDMPRSTSLDPVENLLKTFGGPQMESMFFYQDTIEIRFDPIDHVYYRVADLGNLIALLNVSTVSHIVDKSDALIPWAAKVTIEKLLRTIPVQNITTGPDDVHPVIVVPSMSLAEFTKIALEAKSAHKDKLDDAGEVGKEAHAWIEQHIKCILSGTVNTTAMPADQRASSCCIAALDWMQKHNVRWLATERKVYSKEHDVCGTLDGMAWTDSCDDKTCCKVQFKDHLSLVDWKSSNHLYTEFLYQSSAYLAFILEELKKV